MRINLRKCANARNRITVRLRGTGPRACRPRASVCERPARCCRANWLGRWPLHRCRQLGWHQLRCRQLRWHRLRCRPGPSRPHHRQCLVHRRRISLVAQALRLRNLPGNEAMTNTKRWKPNWRLLLACLREVLQPLPKPNAALPTVSPMGCAASLERRTGPDLQQLRSARSLDFLDLPRPPPRAESEGSSEYWQDGSSDSDSCDAGVRRGQGCGLATSEGIIQ